MKSLFSSFLFLLCSAAFGQSSFWDPISSQRSTTPKVYNQNRNDLISTRVRNADTVGVYWLGNSITHWWENAGKDVWDQYYGNRFALNAGIAGDQTQGVLDRLLKGNLDFKPGVHPHVAVVMLGTNNLGDLGDRPEATLEGIRAILQLMIRRMPYTRILLLGIFPRTGGNGNGSYMDQIRTINEALEQWEDGDIIHFLDVGDIFLNNNGEVNRNIMSDGLHPNARGYELWAEAMEPKLKELLEMEQLRAIRIMPLGNSITEGTSTKEAYRFHLDPMLRKAGYHIDFVGSLKKHANNGMEPSSYEFDINHEGHWAKEADWLVPRVRGYAESANPDMVLLHIGTNDINHETGSAEEVSDRTLSDISDIIDSLREVNPEIAVFLAKIIPTTATEIANANAVIDMLNTKMENFVLENSTRESLIYLVDQNSGFNTNTDMTDPYHPNEAGAKKMAVKWLEAIEEVVDTSGNVVVEVQRKYYAPASKANLNMLLFTGGNWKNLLCDSCKKANVYGLRGQRLFQIEKGREFNLSNISYRGLVLVESF